MDWIAQVPFVGRLAILACAGLWLGGQVNRAIYRLAWNKRSIDPWTPPLEAAPPRAWYDRLPVVGWFGLAREAELHGAGFWIRPLLIELGVAAGLAGLYAWEVSYHLYPTGQFAGELLLPSAEVLHAQFLAHAILLLLMLPATFIDFDEKTIPDEITTPGTIAGLALMALVPTALLPEVVPVINGGYQTEGLLLTAPAARPDDLVQASARSWHEGLNGLGGLALGLGCWLAWCWAVIDKVWWTRSGWGKALLYLGASLTRQPGFARHVGLTLGGGGLIVAVWAGAVDPAFQWMLELAGEPPLAPAQMTLGSTNWQGLLTALVGMAVAGGVIWAFRLVGHWALGREAMGFGDVTLMAMIGAYVGWQPALLAIFLAPLVGVGFAIANRISTGSSEIYFGPFLCAGTLVVVVAWPWVWEGWARESFLKLLALGWLSAAIIAGALLLMGVLLLLLRALRERFYPDEDA